MGVFSDHARNAAHHARAAGEAVSGAYKAAGGVRGAAHAAGAWGKASAGDYQQLHSNMPGAADYVQSQEGRATARYSAGHAVSTFLKRKATQSGKRGTVGGAVGNALFTFAHTAFQSHMDALKHDQRIFTNSAKAMRGSPELQHLTHNELREINSNAKVYGGANHEKISHQVETELNRRQDTVGREQARKDDARHAGRQGRKSAAHAEALNRAQERHAQNMANQKEKHAQKEGHAARLAKLTQVASHGATGAAAANRAVRGQGAAPKKTGGASQGPAAAPKTAAGSKVQVVKQTAHGAIVRGAGGATYGVSKERAAAIKGNRGGSRIRAAGRAIGGRGRR